MYQVPDAAIEEPGPGPKGSIERQHDFNDSDESGSSHGCYNGLWFGHSVDNLVTTVTFLLEPSGILPNSDIGGQTYDIRIS